MWVRNRQKKSEMKRSLAGTEKEKNHHAHTPTDTYIGSEKKGAEKHKKQDTNQCSPAAAAPNLIPLYIAQCSLSVSLPQCCISFPLHLTHSLYSSVSPPPSLS